MAPTEEDKMKVKDGVPQDRPKRRINKPLIEKRRRERINDCLNQLQNLISQLDKDKYKVGRPAKLEKADILEMTVEFVRKTKSKPQVLHTDDSDIQRQSFVAGYRKCMDEIHNFCKENNIPAEVKTSLQQQIDTKMRHLKGEEAVDLSVSADKKEAKLSEQLQAIADSAPPIQPKNTHQIGTINQSPLTQNTNVQIIQRPNNASNGQVTVLCQKEPSTYVLVPTAAICQQVQIQSASQGYPIIVQNSAPSYEIKQSVSERNGQACHLPNSGQIIMVPNSSLSTPVLNTNANLATTPKPVITGNAFAPAAPYYQPMTTSFAVKNCPVSSSKIQVANQVIRLPMASSISTEAHQASSFQNDANDPDTMWRPW